jgi:hypothetical protein
MALVCPLRSQSQAAPQARVAPCQRQHASWNGHFGSNNFGEHYPKNQRRNELELAGKGASVGGSVDIGCGEDVFNSSYTRTATGWV